MTITTEADKFLVCRALCDCQFKLMTELGITDCQTGRLSNGQMNLSFSILGQMMFVGFKVYFKNVLNIDIDPELLEKDIRQLDSVKLRTIVVCDTHRRIFSDFEEVHFNSLENFITWVESTDLIQRVVDQTVNYVGGAE